MATEIGELVWKINGDTRNFDKNLNKTEKGLGKFGKVIKGLGIAAAITAGVVALAKFTKASISAASEAEETANKFNVVFAGVGEAARTAADELASSYGLSNTASEGLLANTADLLNGFGVAKDAALDLSLGVQKLAVDLASFNDKDPAEASRALTSALLGEREAVKQLGIAITDAELKRFAEEQGQIYEEMTKAEKALLTFQLAVEQSGNAIGDFNRSQSSFSNQSKIARANVENLKVAFGEGLLPFANLAVTAFNGIADSLVDAAGGVKDFVTSSEGATAIANIFGGIAGGVAAVGAAANPIMDALKEAVNNVLTPFRELTIETAGAEGAFKVLAYTGEIVAGGIKIISVIVKEQIETVIAFAQAIGGTFDFVKARIALFKGEITEGEFAAIREETGNLWKDAGKELLENYTEPVRAVVDVFNEIKDKAEETAESAADAAIAARERVTESTRAALESAAVTTDGDGGTPGAQAAEDEYQAWLESYSDQLAARYEFEEETRQIVLDAEAQRTEDLREQEEERSRIRAMAAQTVINGVNSLYDSISSLQDASAEKELQRLQVEIDSYEQGTAERIALEEEYDKKSRELEYKQAKRKKANAIFNAVVSTAQAIIGFLADPSGFAGIALSILAGITGAAQIAAIAAQPLPQLAEGGIVQSSPGGTDVTVGEGGSDEAIIPLEESGLLQQRLIVNIGTQPIIDTVIDGINRQEIIVEAV